MAQSEYLKDWRAKNGDKVRAAKRAWARRNRLSCNASQCRWAGKNAEHVRAYLRDWKEAHPEAVLSHRLLELTKKPELSLFTAFLQFRDDDFEMNELVDRGTPLTLLMEKEEALA